MKLFEAVVWRTMAWLGIEECSLWKDGEGWLLSGSSMGVQENVPYRASYSVACDESWRTTRVGIELERGDSRKTLTLLAEGRGWKKDGLKFSAIEECLDVDLQFSPCTNMLPLRRLRPRVGETVRLVAAWVRFPSLRVQPLEQRYTNLGGNKYRYRSNRFVTEIQVDRFGLPRSYPDFWIREATYRPSRKSRGR